MNDIQEFHKYFQDIALKFLKENNLGLQTKYAHVSHDDLVVMPQSLLRQDNTWNKTTFKTDNEILKKLNKTQIAKIEWEDYRKPFFKKLYHNASDKHKELLQKNRYVIYGFDEFCEALSDDKNEMIDYAKKAKAMFNVIGDSWRMKALVDLWKKSLDEKSFNELMLDYFTFYQKEGKKKKSRINMEFVFHNYVKDDETFNKLMELLPKVETSDIKDIFNDNLIVFEVSVDKNKLTKYIKLEDNDAYNHMHRILSEELDKDEIKKIFGITKVNTEQKFRSAKEYNFTIKVEKDSHMNKDEFKKVLLSIYKGYEELSVESKYRISEHMTKEWFMKHYLNLSLATKDNIKEKRIKI